MSADFVVERDGGVTFTLTADEWEIGPGGALVFTTQGVAVYGIAPRCWKTVRPSTAAVRQIPPAPPTPAKQRTALIPAFRDGP